MRIATGITRISNGDLIDGTGSSPVRDAVVVVDGGRISYAGPAIGAPPLADGCRTRSTPGAGRSCRAWSRPTSTRRTSTSPVLEDLDIKYPSEIVTLLSTFNARLALECGYTVGPLGGSLFNIDVWLEEAIETDIVVGPRFVPGGREICGVGGLMDWNPDFRKIGMEGVVLLVNGPDEARSAARQLVKDGVEWVKTYPTGDAAAPAPTTTTRSA